MPRRWTLLQGTKPRSSCSFRPVLRRVKQKKGPQVLAVCFFELGQTQLGTLVLPCCCWRCLPNTAAMRSQAEPAPLVLTHPARELCVTAHRSVHTIPLSYILVCFCVFPPRVYTGGTEGPCSSVPLARVSCCCGWACLDAAVPFGQNYGLGERPKEEERKGRLEC